MIRNFQNTDRDALVGLWGRVFGYPGDHNEPATALDAKLTFDRHQLLLVAVDRDRLIGSVMGGYDGHRGWLYSLAVDASRRREGIGRQLVNAMERRLRELGCMKVNLQVVEDNAEVVAFYHRLGFNVEPRISLGKRLY